MPTLNSVLGSTTGTDVEFVEIFGVPGASLDGVSLIFVESDDQSSNGTIDFRLDFGSSAVFGQNGVFLVGNELVNGVDRVTPDLLISNNSFENSSYTVALVETSSITGDTVTGSENVLDAVGVTDGGATDSFFFGAPVVGPDGPFLPAGFHQSSTRFATKT